jgi:hypothetical protein
MAINFDDYNCEYCGKKATNVVYAAFVCDNPDCIEKARLARGGPGGHMLRKAQGKPIIPEDLEAILDEDTKSDIRDDQRRD